MKKLLTLGVLLFSVFLLSAIIGFSIPEGGQVSWHNSTRHNATAPKTMDGNLGAMAGNITYVNITAVGISRTWAGYYGNVSGTLVLQTFGGSNMYSWTMAAPYGKVLASNSTISDWTGVYCWNTSVATAQGLHISEWNTKYGANDEDYDSINNTFSPSGSFETFYIGNKEFGHNLAGTDDDSCCPMIQLYNKSGVGQGTNYQEIILQEGAQGAANPQPALIYVSIINSSAYGFDGTQIDFQMIVPDDGHGTDADTDTYYFYVELEAGPT